MVVRYAAPVVFLVAVTIAVLLVRSGLSESNEGASPPASVTDTSSTTTTTRPGTTTTKTSAGARFYEIQAGDTLETVAAEFDTTVEQLLILNPEIDPVALGIGERIRVK